MSYLIEAYPEQIRLSPMSLEEFIPPDDPARFIKDFVELLDFDKLGFIVPEVKPNKGGSCPYGAKLLLSAWLYCYIFNVRSTRGVEKVCCSNLSAIWLCDWNMPDHNTFWRFLSRNEKLINQMFKEITLVASKVGLVDLTLQALDGTKIKSEVSTRSCCKKEKLERMLERVDEGIDEVMQQIKDKRITEEQELKLTKELSDKEARKEKLEAAYKAIQEIKRKQINPNDLDARIMKFDNVKRCGYNAQVVVEDKSDLIVAEKVVNDENDTKMLTTMVEEVKENLGEKALVTVADCGYYSPEEIIKAEEKDIEVLVNIPKRMNPELNEGKYHKSKFRYDKEKDVYICPEGKELVYKGKKKDRNNEDMENDLYRCISYKDCPNRYECSKSKRGVRSIEKGPQYEAVMRQLEKQKEQVAREKLKRRKSLAERVFAQIKWNMGFTRFTVRGLEKVNAQWSLVCIAYNLKKLYKIWVNNRLIFAKM